MSSFDAGSVEARLVLDRSEFVSGLEKSKREGERFEREKFTASLGLDDREVRTTISRVRGELAALRGTSLNIGVSGGTAQIQAIRQQMEGLSNQNLGIRVRSAGVAQTFAQLRQLDVLCDRLDGRTVTIRADFDAGAANAQIAILQARLRALDGQSVRTSAGMSTFTRSVKGLVSKAMPDLIAAAMLAAPALFPLTAAAINAAGAFATLGVAAAGVTAVFGMALFGAIKNVSELNKTLETAKTALDTQRAALALLEPGTDAYARQLEKVEAAQKAVNKATKAFSPAQAGFAGRLTALKGAWKDFVTATEGATLPVAGTFLGALQDALPQLVPLVKKIAPEFQKLADSIRGWVNNGGLQRFIGFLQGTGIPVFRNLRLAGANIAAVFGDMFRAFAPQARGMADSFRQMTADMAKWSGGGGFERFIGRVNENAPQVRAFFTALWDAMQNIGDALRPLGPLGLGFVTILLQLVAAIPPGFIQAVYLGFIAWRAALLGLMIIGAITKLVRGMILVWRALNFAFVASPIGFIIALIIALVAVFVVLWLKCEGFRNFWKMVWEGIKTAAVWVWEKALKPAFNGIMAALRWIGDAAMWLWKKAIKPAFEGIWLVARVLMVVLGTVLFTPLYLAFKVLRAVVMWLWTKAFRPVFHFIVGAAKLWWAGIKIYFNFVWGIIKKIGDGAVWLWKKAIKPAFDGIVWLGKQLWKGIKLYFDFVWKGTKKVGDGATWLWRKAIKPAFNAIGDGAKWLWNKGIKPPFNLVIKGVKTVGGWAKWLWNKGIKPHWDRITAGTGKLKDGMIKIWDKMVGGIKKVWNALKKIAAVPVNFVIDTVYNGGIVKVWNKIAGAVGLDKMKLGKVGKIKFAEGGGAGPVRYGRAGIDSVNAQLMPGEHVWTSEEVRNAGGHGAMAALRSQFASTGKARIAPGIGGPATYAGGSGGPGQRYALGGGIIDWAKDKAGDIGGALKSGFKWAGNKLQGGWDWVKDITRGAIGKVGIPVMNTIKGGVKSGINGVIPGSPPWQKLAAGTATKPIDMLIDWMKTDDAKHTVGGANVGKALSWARKQEGKPYIWGGVGPKGYDCSGFMSGIQNIIDGRSPHSRRWATMAFPPGPSGWKRNAKAPFSVGITNAGVGHTAGTLAGVNVESRGGDGVVVGKGARGTNSGLFSSKWGYTPSRAVAGGGSGRWAETASAVLREIGVFSKGNLRNVLRAIQKESSGNPRNINLTDSNARRGTPSMGLLQTIGPTFNAYAGKYRGRGAYDPYANIYAAVRYARATYGSGWSSRMAQPGGYFRGGVMPPGLHMVGEKGPEMVASTGNDRVFSSSDTDRLLRKAVQGPAGQGGQTVMPRTIVVRIGEYEFDAVVDDIARGTIADVVREADGSR